LRGWSHGSRLAGLYRWTKREPLYEIAGIDHLKRHISELLAFLECNQDILVHFAAAASEVAARSAILMVRHRRRANAMQAGQLQSVQILGKPGT
jgi:hypothetical protein